MIKLENISFSYSKHPLLTNLSLSFSTGKFYSIFGPNGSGKSTLLKIITGELSPNSGTVTPHYKTPLERARNMSVVVQEIPAKIPLTVYDIVALGRYPWDATQNSQAVDEAIETLYLTDIMDKKYNELSGGERQRVMLARALAQTTKIILLDEPSSALDIGFQNLFYRTLQEYSRKDKCIIMISHDLFTAPRYIDEAILLDNGKVVDNGNCDQVLSKDNLGKVFFSYK